MSYRVRIKVCGMTRAADIIEAIELGVDALGFIFYAGSKRAITLAQAKNLIKEVSPFVTSVAVVVNPHSEFVKQLLSEIPIHCLQFHGDESPAFCSQFNVPYIKAIAAVSSQQIQKQIAEHSRACGFLFDTPARGTYGGTGQTFDWHRLPVYDEKPIILAGGLNSTNVQQAVTLLRPYAVDVCSGVEKIFGCKDHSKMREFVSAVRRMG